MKVKGLNGIEYRCDMPELGHTKTRVDPTGRVCTVCREYKAWSAYHKTRNAFNGHTATCKDCAKSYKRQYRTSARNRENRFSKYGLTPAGVLLMLEYQKYACLICRSKLLLGSSRKGNPTSLNIDHDHKTGKVRGLLCQRCNRGLGQFLDDHKLLRQAAQYLESNG